MEHRPDVIVSGGEMITLGIMDTAKDLEINIPDDIGLLSFGNLANSKLVVPSLAYIESFPGLVGRKSAEMLLECLKNSNYSVKHISIKTEFRIGNSLRNINKTKQDAAAKKAN
jgi:LacI family transcriptional regulator